MCLVLDVRRHNLGKATSTLPTPDAIFDVSKGVSPMIAALTFGERLGLPVPKKCSKEYNN